MASLFDQYEEELDAPKGEELVSENGYSDMFSIERVIQELGYRIVDFSLSNDTLALSMINNYVRVFRGKNIHLNSKPDLEIDVSQTAAGKVNRMFAHPTMGNHLLLVITPIVNAKNNQSSLYYTRLSSQCKLKKLNLMHGHDVTAVAWNIRDCTSQNTGNMLLGTSKGLIFEIVLSADQDNFFTTSSPELLCKQGFISIPTSFENSSFQFYYKNSDFDFEDIQFIPTSFAWHIGGSGILFGQVNTSESSLQEQKFLVQHVMLDCFPSDPPPVSFALTEFHIIALYSNKIMVASILLKKIVYKRIFEDEPAKFMGMKRDIKCNTLVACGQRSVYRLNVNNESRNIWKIYLEKGEYDLSKQYCFGNTTNLDLVLQTQAGKLFENEEYMACAEIYSKLDDIPTFEEIALKFIAVGQFEALKLYLSLKILTFGDYQSSQFTILCLWAIELYQSEMDKVKSMSVGDEDNARYLQLDSQFVDFIKQEKVRKCVESNKYVVYKILSSHNDTRNLQNLAISFGDYSRVIGDAINRNDYQKVLSVYSKSSVPKEAIYGFITELIYEEPKVAVDLLIQQSFYLDVSRLLPAIVSTYDDKTAIEIIRLLEHLVQLPHLRDQSMHNYLLTLYAKHQRERLMPYLIMQGQELNAVNYDARYALSLCREHKLIDCCVHLCALLGLWEYAVNLALDVSVDLAKQTASLAPVEDEQMCRKLWLKIAKKVVTDGKDIEKAMEFIKQCELIKIQDILPFFPDFTNIKVFKHAICEALEEYSQKIDSLKEEMNDANTSSEQIRNSLHQVRDECRVIDTSDVCASCGIQLLLRPFYAFPCDHSFHADCLLAEVIPHLNEEGLNDVQRIQRQLSSSENRRENASSKSNNVNVKQQLQAEMDNIVASQCFFCGNIPIEQIDQPFIRANEMDYIRQEWD